MTTEKWLVVTTLANLLSFPSTFQKREMHWMDTIAPILLELSSVFTAIKYIVPKREFSALPGDSGKIPNSSNSYNMGEVSAAAFFQ